MAEDVRTLLLSIKNSPLLRVLLIGFLILLLQIPIAMIADQIRARQTTRDQAAEEVTGKWGREQTIIGPMLRVPYIHRWTETDERGQNRTRETIRHANFLPEVLDIRGTVEIESLHRGIFEVPVYRSELDLTGQFQRPNFVDWQVSSKDILWDRAQLMMGISDARALNDQVALQWNGQSLRFEPGAGDFGGSEPGIHVSLKNLMEGEQMEFSLSLNLNGSSSLRFAPFGRNTTVQMKSSWPHPSFQGNWLPAERLVNDEGFEAKWVIPHLGRNYPQQWRSSSDYGTQITESHFGIDFLSSIDHYRMAERSVKYEIKFLLMTFLVIWLFEVVGGLRVHSLQYILVGTGMCLFYLLQLSFAEHLGFLRAYVIASVAVTALITIYSVAVLRTIRRAAVMGVVLVALYAYLYVVLQEQDYALLIGSIGIFVALAVVMYVTRKIDWHNLSR